MATESTRLSVNIDATTRQYLEEKRDAHGTTLSEALRRMVLTGSFFDQVALEGGHIHIDDGETTKEVVILG